MTARAVAKPPAARRSPRADTSAPHRCDRGRPWPLGATLEAGGVNFAIHSSIAEKIELCLFDSTGTREIERIALPCRTDDVWHGFVPGLQAGARYGLRVHGPNEPHHRWRGKTYQLLQDPDHWPTVDA